MKKKQKRAGGRPALGAAAEGSGDLEAIIHSHAEFFDHLIELIPAKFYLPNEDTDTKPWYQGLNKAAKASLKQQSKQNLKLARRTRFDPDKEQPSTLEILQRRETENADLPEDTTLASESSDAALKPHVLEKNRDQSVTYEELREKLRRKIELLRGNRGEKKIDEKKEREDVRKRKRGADSSHGGEKSEAEEIIEYGKVKIGDENEEIKTKKKKRKLSKEKELEKAKRLQEVKKENPYVASRESWKAATNRAIGIKVHDNARQIKDSLKREKRRKEKNAEKWNERVEMQEKKKRERQDKRKQNIEGRINDKKMRKIAKREKKLLRPGFEGRKEGFITKE